VLRINKDYATRKRTIRILSKNEVQINQGEIINNTHNYLSKKLINDWAGKGIRIQEHDSFLSDIFAVNYKDKFESSEHPPFSMADDNNNGDKHS
jgi:hypothetical protein